MVIAVLAALAAGACFAAAGVLQQRAASEQPRDESLSPRLIAALARERRWLAGIGLAVVSYAFQALALAYGALAVVQPLIVTELIFAIPLSARIRGRRIGPREWGGAVVVASGLALAIAAADPRGGSALAAIGQWLYVLPAAAAIALVAALVGRKVPGRMRAAVFGAAAAVTMGAQSALLQSTSKVFEGGVVAGLTSWQPYVMAAFSFGGLLLVQSAFQAGPLAISLPVIDVVEPTTAVVIGIAIFGDRVNLSPGALGLTAIAIVALVGGIVLLDTSPLVRDLYRAERRDASPTAVRGTGPDVKPSPTQARVRP
ncbi:MAG: DMT family transporter [Mycobacteriales bacterium]